MRIGRVFFAFALLSGCSAMMVGGSGTGGYEADSREAAVARADSAITARISGDYKSNPVVNKFAIGVQTYKGTVTLSGTVANVQARDQAGKIANDTDGVVIVNNEIVVED